MSQTESSQMNTMPKAKTTVFTLNTITTKSDKKHLKNIKYYHLLNSLGLLRVILICQRVSLIQ